MDKETIFNIYVFCNNDIITKIGFRAHDFKGNDDEKIDFLLSRVEIDINEIAYCGISENFKVKSNGQEINGLTHERYNTFLHNGTEGILFEPIFQLFNAPENPLSVSTMVVDGEIKITRQQKFETAPKTKFTESIIETLPKYYLEEFMTKDGFDLGGLIDSDFLVSIRLLFQNQKYVSSIKLLMAAIDTFAFLEYGDASNGFKKWLSNFCDLTEVGATEEEIWEYRNSIIHMTNAFSRKVLNKKVQALSFYVNNKNIDYMTTNGEAKYFNLITFMNAITNGIEKWCDSYNIDRAKFEAFCERYDLIISDSRYAKIDK